VKKKAAHSPKTPLNIYHTTWHHIAEEVNLQSHHCQNLKFHMSIIYHACIILFTHKFHMLGYNAS